MQPPKRCKYCNDVSEGEFCGEECEASAIEFQEYVDRYSGLFLLAAVGPILLIIPGFVFFDYILVFLAAMMLVLGSTVIVFPFVTPETVSMFGVKKSIRIARWCGYSVLLMGAVFAAMFILMRQ
ncbi:MAG: hypothetical protein LBJ20_05215 [Candidatus Methanoplasma sp.]|jgi:hypothetical protein|nr:hypothetical protein [Candidatus Methanoplasma sp.]